MAALPSAAEAPSIKAAPALASSLHGETTGTELLRNLALQKAFAAGAGRLLDLLATLPAPHVRLVRRLKEDRLPVRLADGLYLGSVGVRAPREVPSQC